MDQDMLPAKRSRKQTEKAIQYSNVQKIQAERQRTREQTAATNKAWIPTMDWLSNKMQTAMKPSEPYKKPQGWVTTFGRRRRGGKARKTRKVRKGGACI